jgi:hypothetical protein
MSACQDWMSTNVGFILFNPRQDPIELSRGYLASAKCTNAGDIYFKGAPQLGQLRSARAAPILLEIVLRKLGMILDRSSLRSFAGRYDRLLTGVSFLACYRFVT